MFAENSPRLHLRVSFFQKFSGGGPPDPPYGRGATPLPYPPQTMRKAHRPLPLRGKVFTAAAYFWYRTCYSETL